MLPDDKVRCPATGFAKTCKSIVTQFTCPKFVTIRGRDPQTAVEADRHGCVDSFLPLLLIENAQVSRQTGAAVESFRNEVVKANEATEQRQREALMAFAKTGGPRVISK